jgi:cysteine desulfurase/selenocysteine lyase
MPDTDFNPQEITQIRTDTPGAQQGIHFNNAGAALMPAPVLRCVTEYLNLEAHRGGYETAALRHEQIEQVYDSIASLIGAQRTEIAVVENATRAWDMAFYSIPFKPGDRILTNVAAYGSDYIAFLQLAAQKNLRIDIIPDDEHEQVDVHALEATLDERVKLIALTHVPTNGGLVNPAAAVGRAARRAGVYYLLDACQSVGQMPVNVDEIGCDMLSATSRKYLRGPRGMGFLYVRQERIAELEPPFLDLHAARWVEKDRYEIRPDARRFENWECNYAAKVGMGCAIDYALELGLERIWRRVQTLAANLRGQLQTIPGVSVHDKGQVRCGIVTFMTAQKSAAEVQSALSKRGINVTTTSPFGTRLDMEARGLEMLVRASVHYYNTEEEIERFCGEVRGITG